MRYTLLLLAAACIVFAITFGGCIVLDKVARCSRDRRARRAARACPARRIRVALRVRRAAGTWPREVAERFMASGSARWH